MAEHGCARPGCPRLIAGPTLACKQHWYELPEDIRTDLIKGLLGKGPVMDAMSRALAWWTSQSQSGA